jgi:hypothetical protein
MAGFVVLVLSTSNLAPGAFVPMPTLPPGDWKMFEFPILSGLKNWGMKLGVPLPKIGRSMSAVVGAWAETVAATLIHTATIATLLYFIETFLRFEFAKNEAGMKGAEEQMRFVHKNSRGVCALVAVLSM